MSPILRAVWHALTNAPRRACQYIQNTHGLLDYRQSLSLYYIFGIGFYDALLALCNLWGGPLHGFDASLLATSIFTGAGFNNVNLSKLLLSQQVIIFFAMVAGHQLVISCFPLIIRIIKKHPAAMRFKKVREERNRHTTAWNSNAPTLHSSATRSRASLRQQREAEQDLTTRSAPSPKVKETPGRPSRASFDHESDGELFATTNLVQVLEDHAVEARLNRKAFSPQVKADKATAGVDEVTAGPSRPSLLVPPQEAHLGASHIAFSRDFSLGRTEHSDGLRLRRAHSNSSIMSHTTRTAPEDALPSMRHDFDSGGYINTHGQFWGLNDEGQLHVDWLNYYFSWLLVVVIPIYYLLWFAVGFLWLSIAISALPSAGALDNGSVPWWNAMFLTISSFTNAGAILYDSNMAPFKDHWEVNTIVLGLVLAGNNLYPVFLRLFIMGIKRSIKIWTWPAHFNSPLHHQRACEEWAEVIEWGLEYPRRCYTLLFPAKATWWLAGITVALTLLEWGGFELFNLNNDDPWFKAAAEGARVSVGLFQAFCLRSPGFTIVPMSSITQTNLLFYMLVMAIAPYPIALIRNSNNVREQEALHEWAEDYQRHPIEASSQGFSLRRVIAKWVLKRKPGKAIFGDNAYITWAFLCKQFTPLAAWDVIDTSFATGLVCFIEGQYSQKPYDLRKIWFEMSSAHSRVGLSTGVSWDNVALCGTWQKLSQLVICVVMVVGCLRSAPPSVDMAVQPDDPGPNVPIEVEMEEGLLRRSSAATIHSTGRGEGAVDSRIDTV